MTNRVESLTVVLDKDYRDDDVQEIAQAILMIKGVVKVHLGEPVDHLARDRARRELVSKLRDVLREG